MDVLSKLFDTSDFPARWHCGHWTDLHGWLHIISDLGVWSAYVAIPCVLGYFVLRRRDVPFRNIFWLFGAFILACGTTHLMEAIIFWWPAYRLAGLIKLFTALVSWGTVLTLIPATPRALAMRSPSELAREIAARREAESALEQANVELEKRVAGRTAELAEANAALRESEQWWRGLAEALPNLVWTDRPDGTCDYLSSQWGRYTGIPEQELLGFAWLERVIHPDDRQRTLDCWMRAVEDKGIYDLEYRIRRHDGEYRWFKTRGLPIRDGQGRIVKWFGTCTDIEDQKRAVEELGESDRLKDEFLAMLAHELRNPLAAIRNALYVMKEPGANGTILPQARAIAERQVDHMARLLDDLLDVARISRGRIELRKVTLDAGAVVHRTLETIRPLIEARRHELEVSLPAEPVWLQADPTRLEQILNNLLNNAAKYSEPGGKIVLSVESEASEVAFRVRDTGIGIAAEILPRIFQPFVQAQRRLDRSQGGLGIGLTLVKKLVELHGGSVVARSAGDGQGSEFVVRLPARPAPAEPMGKSKTMNHEATSRLPSRRVLVVDDNRDAADSLAMLLRLAGQDARAAYDGPSALAETDQFRPAIVFLDIGMPEMDGYEVARRLRQAPESERVFLVALTG